MNLKMNTSMIRRLAAVALLCTSGGAVFAQCHMGGNPTPGYPYGTNVYGTNWHGTNWMGTNWIGPAHGCVQFMAPVRQQCAAIGQATWNAGYGPVQWHMAFTQLRQHMSAMNSAYALFQSTITDAQLVQWQGHLLAMDQQHERVIAAWRALKLELNQSRPRPVRIRMLADGLRTAVRDWKLQMNALLAVSNPA